jgi:hypothetical protein
MPRPALVFWLFALVVCGWLHPAAAEEKPGERKLSFNRDIRPILTNNCFACHGPDANHREADLRLDVREVAVEMDAIVPGSPEKSELVSRILSSDPEKQMPPPKAKKTLTAKDKELLQRWIKEGAEYEGHWAFLPVANPKPPEVKNAAWVRNNIDRFVLAELERLKISPSKEADRATLIRRLSLDLLGLPPTPEEVQTFLADERPDAYERLVDRLLASTHYGERWGRHWLDQARYADSNGYTIDSERAMWPYRDWVIKATNDDMPFDQFTIEQLAGDLLPQPTKMQRIATAFHRNTMINEEGGTDAEQFRNEIVFDRVNTTGSVWLGLTVGCAQCHSHKFDPLSHREYYELFAFFNSSSDVNNRGETLEVLPGEILGRPASDAVGSDVAKAAKQKLDKLNKEAPARQKAWEEQLAAGVEEPKWVVMDIDRFDSSGGRKLKKLDDNSILIERDGPPKDTFELLVSAKLTKLAALRLIVMPDASLPSGGPGTANNGNFVLSEFEVDVDGKPADLKHALADHEKKGYAVLGAIDRDKKTGWALEMNQGGKGQHEAWFFFDDPLPMTTGKITVKLRHDVNDHYHIGRFTVMATDVAPATHPDKKLWQQTLDITKKPAAERSKQEADQITRTFRELDSEIALAQREADMTAKKSAGTATLMVMRELPQPRTTYLLSRGDFLNPDKKLGPLTPNTPAWLPKFEPSGSQPTRLDLAKWLISKQNPLTPRVAVNRVWMEYFGTGLVESENDFGLQGTPPTHPELLDYLATQFMQNGWSRKALHRLIVTSATYRQSSKFRPELKDVDPDNKLLARQKRLRLDAEALRDTGLAACGLLDRSQGGPTVHPPQPEGVYAFTQNKKPWNSTPTNERYRRAMYTTFIRSAPYPLFTTFDAPSFSAVCTRRPRSNTPLQALTVANDEAFVEFSQALASRLWQDNSASGDEAELARIRRAFVLCLAREPSARESDAVLKFLRQQQSAFAADSAASKAAAPATRPSQLSEADGAAWSAVARAIFNTDEFITRE